MIISDHPKQPYFQPLAEILDLAPRDILTSSGDETEAPFPPKVDVDPDQGVWI